MYFKSVLLLAVLMLYSHAVRAEDIGFVEKFSLSDERSIPLKQLIPGTEDYYYFHCLQYQNTGQFEKIPEILSQWIKRYNYTSRVEEIRNRQALFEYKRNPKQTMLFLKQRLNLQFNYQKQQLTPETKYPQTLDQSLINQKTLSEKAFGEYENLNGFEDSALEFLKNTQLNEDQRRDFLQRLKRPDFSELPSMVVADLRYRNSGGFGSIPIHRKLLLEQLETCLKLYPDLILDTNFVETYLTKIQPSADVDWKSDTKEKSLFLNRL
ncbi:hypothetical protein HYY75_00740, partial [bacterium]|nr:hypothetical protein [bacterium]